MSPISVSTAPTLYSCKASEMDFLASPCLRLAVLQEVDHVGILRGVSEVVADRRLQHLRDQVHHAAESGDDLGRIRARNVNDLADVQIEFEPVGRPNRDGGQIFVQVVRFGLSVRPIQDHVCSGHQLHSSACRD